MSIASNLPGNLNDLQKKIILGAVILIVLMILFRPRKPLIGYSRD